MDDTFIPELLGTDGSFSSQWLSRFLERLSSRESDIQSFYGSLIKDKETLVYDITPLSPYSELIEWLGYGYNQDGLDLPQVNLGLVFSTDRRIPIYYKLFPGSVNDVVTLKNLIVEMKSFGIKSYTFILDRGFYSEGNILEMLQEHIDFIILLPFTVKAGRQMIRENRDVMNPTNARRHNGRVYYVAEREHKFGDRTVYVYVLYDKRREGTESTSFYNRLMDIENKLSGKRVWGNPTEALNLVAGKFRRYFDYRLDGDVLYVKRRGKAISQAVNRFGKAILLSSVKKDWGEVLSLYLERDDVEKEYLYLKRDLEVMPLRVRKIETRGLLFVFFVALIMRTLLLNRARDGKLLEKESIEDILLEMGKLRVVNIANSWRLAEITRKQRTCLEKMGIKVPIEPKHSY